MLICDTSGLLAYFDASDRHFEAVTAVVNDEAGPFIVSPYVVAELDSLLASRIGAAAQLAALDELAGGAFELPSFDADSLRSALEVIDRYRDQNVGVTDASLVVLANRYRTDRLLTLDRRHFDVVRTAEGRPFTIVP